MSATAPPGWDEVTSALAEPGFHGLPAGETVERIDTQLSAILLVGDRALKLARPVKLSFCDFSTPEKRRAALAAEFELNQRGAPQLYLQISEVTWDGAALALDGDGEAVEPCLVMRRFDQRERFDALLAADALDRATMERLAEAIFAFHEAQEPDYRSGFAGADGLRAVLADNRIEAERYPDTLPPKRLARLHDALEEALEAQAERLGARKAAGFVRHCHGDLHLANIVRWEGAPLLFDAIAFNEHLAVVDVFYDLAFLLMDLEVAGERGLAQAVLNRYLELSGDYDAVALLPLFLGLRAHIRAFVAAASARAESGRAEAARDEEKAIRYLRASADFLQPARPQLLAVGGLSGSGKTSVARALAAELGPPPGAVVLRSDVTRKTLAGVASDEPLPDAAYAAGASEPVYATLRRHAATALSAGHSAILDAVHARPEERAAAQAVARDLGVTFKGLWLEAPPPALKARVGARRGDASDATAEVVERQLDYDLGDITWARVDASGPLEEVVAAARKALELDAG